MFVITADQVDSRNTRDLVGDTLTRLDRSYGNGLALPVDRNAGDELQALVIDADSAIAIALDLTRTGEWSVGMGAGTVELPLGESTRQARGAAFIAARDAVESAKRSSLRFAFRSGLVEDDLGAMDFEALMLVLLSLRDRRTEQGWQVYDLIVAGQTQRAAAGSLGITPQAVSDRMSVAQVKIDLEAHAPLGRLLARLTDTPDSTNGSTNR